MFAIIETGGKQHKVEKGTILEIEKLLEDKGKTVTFDKVFLISDGSSTKIGTPLLEGAVVTGKVVNQTKGDKIIVFKKKAKKRYEKKQGHRQCLTVVEITEIKS
ncbi:MAG: 50S ribosomal protein L21 [Candidatus Gracilibacteria bacterium]